VLPDFHRTPGDLGSTGDPVSVYRRCRRRCPSAEACALVARDGSTCGASISRLGIQGGCAPCVPFLVDRIIVAVAPMILGAGTQAEAHVLGNAMEVEVHRLAHAGAVGQ